MRAWRNKKYMGATETVEAFAKPGVDLRQGIKNARDSKAFATDDSDNFDGPMPRWVGLIWGPLFVIGFGTLLLVTRGIWKLVF